MVLAFEITFLFLDKFEFECDKLVFKFNHENIFSIFFMEENVRKSKMTL